LKFEGVFSVLPTPFNGDGEIDLESLRRVIDLFLKAGVNGVTVLGVTGEVSRLRDKERDVVLHTVLDHVKGRVPVIAGTTAEGLRTCLEYSRAAKATGAAGSFEDDAWRSGFELIVLSVIRMVRAVLPSMEERGGGSILMLTSSSVKEPIVNLGLSNVLRASVAALAKTLANELAPRRIRVNQLIPGRIATDRLNELDTINSQRQGISLSDYRNRAQTTIPLGRYGTPNEFACAAAFLVSGAASYISGATLQVDGGLIRSVL